MKVYINNKEEYDDIIKKYRNILNAKIPWYEGYLIGKISINDDGIITNFCFNDKFCIDCNNNFCNMRINEHITYTQYLREEKLKRILND
jgi:hypothetical protein